MKNSMTNAWVSPKMVRIGNIAAVAGTQPPATLQKSNGGTPCTPGNNCAFS